MQNLLSPQCYDYIFTTPTVQCWCLCAQINALCSTEECCITAAMSDHSQHGLQHFFDKRRVCCSQSMSCCACSAQVTFTVSGAGKCISLNRDMFTAGQTSPLLWAIFLSAHPHPICVKSLCTGGKVEDLESPKRSFRCASQAEMSTTLPVDMPLPQFCSKIHQQLVIPLILTMHRWQG